MPSYLCTWNPKNWDWEEFAQDYEDISEGEPVTFTWRVLDEKINPGDRLFIMRLGVSPTGIVASGTAANGSYREPGEGQLHVEFEIDTLLDSESDCILSQEDLIDQVDADYNWTPQGSGVSIPEDVAERLEEAWGDLIESSRKKTPSPKVDAAAIEAQLLKSLKNDEFSGEVANKIIQHFTFRIDRELAELKAEIADLKKNLAPPEKTQAMESQLLKSLKSDTFSWDVASFILPWFAVKLNDELEKDMAEMRDRIAVLEKQLKPDFTSQELKG